jgi:hypothetical protein
MYLKPLTSVRNVCHFYQLVKLACFDLQYAQKTIFNEIISSDLVSFEKEVLPNIMHLFIFYENCLCHIFFELEKTHMKIIRVYDIDTK